MAREPKPRGSLGLHLLGLYLLFVIPILGAAILFDVQAGRRLQEDVTAADLSLAEAIALETDALLQKAQQAVVEFARMPAVIEMDVEGMSEAFSTGAAARQDINLFYRLAADGTMVFHHPVGPGSTVGVDFSFREYFQAAKTSAGPIFSKGRISPTTQRPVATVVMPIRDAQGRFDGVVATNLELQSLTQTLVVIGQSQGAQRGVQVAIVDAAGQIIAHSQPEGNLLRNVLDTLPGVLQVLAGERGSLIARDEADREWLRSYTPIHTAGWGVIVQRSTEIAFATSRSFHRGLLIALGLISVGGGLFWWGLSNRVIRPLEQLTRFGRTRGQQAEKALVARAPLEGLSRRSDQIGMLAHALLEAEHDVQRRLTELSTLLETSTAVVSSLDTEQVIKDILEQVQRLPGVDTCAILVLDAPTDQLKIRASRGLSESYVQKLHLEVTARQLPAWRAIHQGQPIQVVDVESDPTMAALLPLVRAEGYRSLLAVPLNVPHGSPAVLVVYRADVHRFSAEEVDLVSSFANHAAMALENATLFSLTDEELQKQVRSLGALNQIVLTATQTLVLDDVLNNALEAVVQVMGVEAAWIHLLGEGETTLRLRAQRGFSPTFAEKVAEMEVGAGLTGWVAETGQPLFVQDIVQDERLFTHTAADEGLRSFAAVPLQAKETVVGVLAVATRTDRRFSATELELLSAVGSQIGIAVVNARLYQRSRQAAILEERNRLAREIHDSLAQGLTGIIVQLEAMERLAQRRPDQALQSLQRAKDLARHSLQEARRSVWGLRPRALEDLSLDEALNRFVENMCGDGGPRVTFGVTGPKRALSPDVELNLFRIAQEALSNVQRHAHARSAQVQLDYEGSQVRLVVKDDGIGLPVTDFAELSGDRDHRFGLVGMRERVSLLGGEMQIKRSSTGGTQIEVVVPG